jgi:putative NADH-flavin reductase
MRIALLGATGTIGRRIACEALARGHEVTAVVRRPGALDLRHRSLRVATGAVDRPGGLASVLAGHDAVVSAIGPAEREGGSPAVLVDAARALLRALPEAGVRRLIVLGGAGSLEVAPGKDLVDTPGFPAAHKTTALAHREALQIYRGAAPPLDWTVVSPAASTEPGARSGRYRTGADQLVADAAGNSRISVEDLAVAVLDELEKPRFIRRRMTVGY